jgi:hypothetical protein
MCMCDFTICSLASVLTYLDISPQQVGSMWDVGIVHPLLCWFPLFILKMKR